MKEKIDELLEDFKGRLKNPLILSFILVWLYCHWSILYWVLTVEDNITVDARTEKIIEYITKQGFSGMVFCPLLMSFISLAVYYLIANSAQFIQVWVGKRLNVFMLLKSDKGRYVERVLLEREKKKNKELNNQITDLSQEIDIIKRTKDDSEKIVDDLEIERDEAVLELSKVKQNIDYNVKFKEKLTVTLIYLLGLNRGIPTSDLVSPHIFEFDLNTLKGSWQIQSHNSILNSGYTVVSINIDNDIITRFDGTDYGKITKFTKDSNTSICTLIIERAISPNVVHENERYDLIQINNNEFIGIEKNKYTVIIRTTNISES